ncbi:hypothetical protein DPMN_141587 [Dreissena polymorpha]|uniref:Uncharacterized protein n=1 Tax=Dreissena polymorpha TaxID=45954 RepID=A0A9D4GFM8_DREPO|nr:hypothetical protein DPMN_141587 [Dreissena polymorpha]
MLNHFVQECDGEIKDDVIESLCDMLASSQQFMRNQKAPGSDPSTIRTNLLTNVTNKTARPLFRNKTRYHWTNLLTKFHADQTKNVASRVLARKTAPPTGGYVFQRTGTTFERNQDIIMTNIFDKHDPFSNSNEFHEDWTRNVASRVFTWKTSPQTGGHVFQWTGTTFELN